MNYERKMLKLFLLESGIIKTPQIRQKDKNKKQKDKNKKFKDKNKNFPFTTSK